MERVDMITVTHRGRRYPVPVHVGDRAGDRPLLVLDLHGSHGNAIAQAACSQLDSWADRMGFVVARPEGGIAADSPDSERLWLWNVPGVPLTTGEYPAADARDDREFLTAVIDTIGERLGTRPRAALVGMSGGARMASAYAAARPDRVAALAAVAGLRAAGAIPGAPAVATGDHAAARPVPVLAVHSDDDDVNPYLGADDPRWNYPVSAALQSWRDHNGCTGPVVESDDHRGVVRISSCADDPSREVTLYRLAGGGHSWPGSDEEGACPDLDASAVIADFVARRGVD